MKLTVTSYVVHCLYILKQFQVPNAKTLIAFMTSFRLLHFTVQLNIVDCKETNTTCKRIVNEYYKYIRNAIFDEKRKKQNRKYNLEFKNYYPNDQHTSSACKNCHFLLHFSHFLCNTGCHQFESFCLSGKFFQV